MVFSAHAEVVPALTADFHAWNGILRARGGSSFDGCYPVSIEVYSPRTRR